MPAQCMPGMEWKYTHQLLYHGHVSLIFELLECAMTDRWDVFSFEDSVGFGRHFALLMSGFLQIWFLVASFGTWWSIERFGRRRSFITSAVGMASVMAIMAAMLAIDTPASGIVAAVMLFAYQAFYTWGFMGGIWVSDPNLKTGRF